MRRKRTKTHAEDDKNGAKESDQTHGKLKRRPEKRTKERASEIIRMHTHTHAHQLEKKKYTPNGEKKAESGISNKEEKMNSNKNRTLPIIGWILSNYF